MGDGGWTRSDDGATIDAVMGVVTTDVARGEGGEAGWTWRGSAVAAGRARP